MARIDLANPWQRNEAASMIRAARDVTSDRASTLRIAARVAAASAHCSTDEYKERTAYRFIQSALLAAI